MSTCGVLRSFPPGHSFSSKTGKFTQWYNPVWRTLKEVREIDRFILCSESANIRLKILGISQSRFSMRAIRFVVVFVVQQSNRSGKV